MLTPQQADELRAARDEYLAQWVSTQLAPDVSRTAYALAWSKWRDLANLYGYRFGFGPGIQDWTAQQLGETT